MAAVEKLCEVCSRQAVVYCEVDRAYLCAGCDEHVHGANLLARRHFHRWIQEQARIPLLCTGGARGGEVLQHSNHVGDKQIEAIGSRWGALAVRDSPESESIGNLKEGMQRNVLGNKALPEQLQNEEWPRVEDSNGKLKVIAPAKTPMDGMSKTSNANKPVSPWEGIEKQRRQMSLEIDIRKHLFSFPKQIFEKDMGELEESSKRLEEAMIRMNRLQMNSVGKQLIGWTRGLEDDSHRDVVGPQKDSGLSFVNMYNHSWRPICPRWVWVAKASNLQGERHPASRLEV